MCDEIKTLRTFFRVSNAAFKFQNSIQLAFLGNIIPSKMHQLHKLGLIEIEKETPDLSLIDKLLAEMKKTAEQMKNREPWNFCETPKEKCTMNYCDENGCQNRKRNYVEGNDLLADVSVCIRCKKKSKHKESIYCIDCLYERKMSGY